MSEAKCSLLILDIRYKRASYRYSTGYPTTTPSTSSKVLISILPGSNKYPTGTSSKLLISILLILALRYKARYSVIRVAVLRVDIKVVKVFNDFYSTLTKSILKLEYLKVYDIPFYYERDEENSRDLYNLVPRYRVNGYPTGYKRASYRLYKYVSYTARALSISIILNNILTVISRDIENILEKLPNLTTLIINLTLRKLYINTPRSLGNLYCLTNIPKGFILIYRLPDNLNLQNSINLAATTRSLRYKRVSYRLPNNRVKYNYLTTALSTSLLAVSSKVQTGILPAIRSYSKKYYTGNPTETRYYFISRTLSD
ncbi:hypothetical protein QBC39DRAFT_334470 [Podospora conica]|nr:hypothetical protein QBC39DRAFT_334470 [Schizothecium conicum]